MLDFRFNCRPGGRSILCAGVIAGVLSTLVQVLLWFAFTADFPAILFRDARLAAALMLGSGVLPPPASFDTGVWLAATLIHFALSIVYAALMIRLTRRLAHAPALLAGAACGIALYAVNLYGFTEIFPWFVQARSWITFVAHIAFGMTAIAAHRLMQVRNAQSRPGGH